MKVSQSFLNFVQGVSQQPAQLRSPSQLEDQLNGFSSASEGLYKRPPLEMIAKLATAGYSTALTHPFNKSTDEQGFAIIPGDGTLLVKKRDGSAATVNINTPAADVSYITTGSPKTDLVLTSVGDYTFIVNRTKKPAMKVTTYFDKSVAAGGYYRSLVWVRIGQSERTYRVKLTGHTASYSTGATAANADTANIASQLATSINGAGLSYTATAHGSVLAIHRSGTAYTIEVDDGVGNEGIVLVDRNTPNPGNLPPIAEDRMQVEVTGDDGTDWDNYWVEWDNTKKVWLEAPKPGRTYIIDPANMPHVLRYNATNGQYYYEEFVWNDCLAGDTTTNPEPSFIGKAIVDIGFLRGRLALLTESTLLFSEAGNIGNFWRTTTTALRDSDPIDVKVFQEDPAPFKWMTEFDKTLVLWNGKGQYAVSRDIPALTPSTIAVGLASKYEHSTACRPLVVDAFVFFSHLREGYSALHRLTVTSRGDGGIPAYTSDEVTAQAPRYIAGDMTQMKASATGDMLLLRTSGTAANEVYVYQFADREGALVQSAIHKWRVPDGNTVLSVETDGQYIFMILGRSDGVYLERMVVSPLAVDTGLPVKLLLDQRVDETQCTEVYDSNANTTEITLPYAQVGNDPLVVYGRYGSVLAKAGEVVPHTQTATSPAAKLVVSGDWTSDKYYVGKNYTFSFQPSTIMLRDKGNGEAVTSARLQVHRAFLEYADTGHFHVTVTPISRGPFEYTFNGITIGATGVLIGEIPRETGTFKVPISSKNDTVTIVVENSSPFPCKFVGGSWEGRFGATPETRFRRV